MATKQQAVTTTRGSRDPFTMLRQMASEFDHVFDDWPSFRWPSLGALTTREHGWSPRIDVFERDNQLVTRVDLPGTKKEDVSVEVTDGHLELSGERRRETEEEKDNVYRREREYGSFYRAVPLPQGVTLEDVKATFEDGVLEVSIPLPPRQEASRMKVPINETKAAAKNVA